ncbi:hypothetical protein R6Q57_020141 [Mikania cordata]
MPSSFTIHVLLFVLFVQMVIGADPLYYFCSTTSGNFKPYGPYDQSLNKLLGNLYYQTPSNGFGMASTGQYQAQTFGLSLCRGDVSAEDCKSCVVNASAGIRERCPNNKAATIWYDECLLKYSHSNFFGQLFDQGIFQVVLARLVWMMQSAFFLAVVMAKKVEGLLVGVVTLDMKFIHLVQSVCLWLTITHCPRERCLADCDHVRSDQRVVVTELLVVETNGHVVVIAQETYAV